MAFRILYNAASDQSGVSISESSETSNRPSSNVVDNRIGKPWRTTGVGTEWVTFDLGSAKNVDCVGVFGFNYEAADTFRFQGHTADSWGTPTVNETVTLATDSDSNILQRVTHFFTQDSLRYWRWSMDDPVASKSYFQTGRIMFGQYYETSRDASADLRVEVIDPSSGQRAPGEVPIVTEDDEKPRFRRIRTTFEFVTTTERDKWETILNTIGNSRPAMISWDPDDRPSKDSAYVYLVTPLSLAHEFVGYYSIASLVWEEKTR